MIMYLKLSLRNAKRSALDYLLYIFTATVLVAVMCISNCIAAFGENIAGFKTASLPLLIVLIMVVLIGYINDFMLKQRSKELATYILLGMEKCRLSFLFVSELFIIGIICFVLGVLLGCGVYCLCFHSETTLTQLTDTSNRITFELITSSILQTLVYFCLAELLSSLRIMRKLYKLQINRLINEKRSNNPLKISKPAVWGLWFLASLFTFLVTLCGVVFIPNNKGDMLLSFLSIPMLASVFTFYKWIYAYFCTKRAECSEKLYQGTRLYHIAEITSNAKMSANTNFIFSSCLLFSAISFVFGTLMLSTDISVFSSADKQWMGFLQISICVIFMVIYFSILSLFQITELKQQSCRLKILSYMGKNEIELKSLIKTQILTKLFLPAFMCFAMLSVCTPLVNIKLNSILPPSVHNIVLNSLEGFAACFAVLYICYFFIIYNIGKRCI